MPNVLDPYYQTEVVQNIRTDINSFRGAQLLTGGVDLKTETSLTIEYDIVNDDTGMTPPTQMNDPSPIHTAPPVGHMNFTNQEWREKAIIDREKIAKLRKPGNALDELWGEEYMVEQLVNLNGRLETRFEWMRWKPLSGSLVIPATKTMPSRTIDYKVPTANKPTAATLWSNLAAADPLSDLDLWKLLFRGTGARPYGFFVNQKTDNLLKQNAKIRDLLRTQYGRDLIAADSLSFIIKQQLGGLTYEVYDGGYIDDAGNFQPFIPDGVAIMVGQGMTGNMMDLVTSPNNYEDIFNGHVGKFALTKEIGDDPKQWTIVNGATVLPRMRHTNWHVYATIA